MTASEIYERIKAEFERLHASNAARGEWVQLSLRLVEAVMKCQQIVIEHQKTLIAHARGGVPLADYEVARRESKDTIHILDRFDAMHQQIRMRLAK